MFTNKEQQITYMPSPTGVEFHNSNADVRLVLGNVGSGKSTMMIVEILKMCIQQKPDKNNQRTSKWVIVRETYPQLLETTFASFKIWLKPNSSTRRYKQSSPMKILWTDPLPDGTRLNVEFILSFTGECGSSKVVYFCGVKTRG